MGGDTGYSVAVGPDGSVVVVGAFEDTVDFDPSPAIDFHTSNGSGDVFVSRFHADGTYAWTRTMGAGSGDVALAAAIDVSGDVLITGWFWDTVDFDPSPDGIDLHTSLGFSDSFITKLSGNGNYHWTRTFGGSSVEGAWGIAVGSDEAVYAVGVFHGTVDFDPSDGVDEHVSNGGSSDAYVVKVGSDGSYLWTVTFGGEDGDQPNGVAINNESLYIAGYFSETIDFDPGDGIDERTSEGVLDAFVSKLSLDGDYEWVWTVGGIEGDGAEGIVPCGDGTVVVTGDFNGGPVDFDAGEGVDERFSNGQSDLFVTKLGSDGSHIWTHTAGNSEQEFGLGIAVDSTGSIVATGTFGGNDVLPGYTVDFDPSGGDPHATHGESDLFVTMLETDGSYAWTYTAGGENLELAQGITVSDAGKIYVTGHYRDTVDFDPGASTDEHTAVGDHDIFLTTLLCVDELPCEGDANDDDVVDPLDSGFVMSRFGCDVGTGDPNCDAADQNGDGVVDPLDVGFILSRLGDCD